MTQLTVPETKSYVWEGLVFIPYSHAKKHVAGMKHVKIPMYAAIEQVKALGKKLSGARLKALLVAISRQEQWYPRVITPPPRLLPHSTDDPNIKRCMKCRELKPAADFRREASKKQRDAWKYSGTTIEGQELLLSNRPFMRGYTRPARRVIVARVTCNTCAVRRRTPRPSSPGCMELEAQLKLARARINTRAWLLCLPENVRGRQQMDTLTTGQHAQYKAFFLYKKEVIKAAAAKLRALKKAKVTRYPDSYHDLVTPEQQHKLEALHNSVDWKTKKIPALW